MASHAVQSVVAPKLAHTEDMFLNQETGRMGTYTMDNLPAGADRIVNTVRALFRARTMREYCEVLPALSRDVVWDAPPISTSRKGHLRVATYLAKSVALLDFEPALINITHLSGGRHLVEITGTARLCPKRSWVVPPSLLLPQSVPIRSTIKVGVNGSLADGKIEMIYGQWHNLPSLPWPLRVANGLFLGGVFHLMEPIWSRAMEFVGEDFYKRKRERAIADGTAGTVDTAIDLGTNAINNVGDAAWSLFSTLVDTFNRAVETSRHYADSAVQTARDTARTAADTAAGAARTAADTAAGVARSTYETVMPSELDSTLRKDMPATDKAREAAGKAADAARRTAGLDPSGAQQMAVR